MNAAERLAAGSGAWLAASWLTASPALAATRRLGGGDDLGVSLGRVVAALIVSLLVALAAILLIRQRSGKQDMAAIAARFRLRPRAIDVVETRRLSPHADICLVRHEDREYLLLLMAGSARLLRERPAPEPETEAEPCV